ncbi:hypothetical protein [Amycolatopsis sp. NPDC004079]|uniref:hypothetical protein n=1 Tax=Amycolatopsis sp. NPDC004079 TaxID=3154549 RepID=UPI0033A4A977
MQGKLADAAGQPPDCPSLRTGLLNQAITTPSQQASDRATSSSLRRGLTPCPGNATIAPDETKGTQRGGVDDVDQAETGNREEHPRNPDVRFQLEVVVDGRRIVGQSVAGPMSLRTIASFLRNAAEKVENRAFEDLRDNDA